MKWNINYTLQGPLGPVGIGIPNSPPVVESESLGDILRQLSDSFDKVEKESCGFPLIGITIEKVEE